MTAAILAALAPLLALLPMPEDYPWLPPLPPTWVCERCLDAARQDLRAIDANLELLGGRPAYRNVQLGGMMFCIDSPRQYGGWRVLQLEESRRVALRLVDVWQAAAWATSDAPVADGYDYEHECHQQRPSREEAARQLVELVGLQAFALGELPMPLSCR